MGSNEVTIAAQLAQRDTDRLKTYRRMLDFYHGQHWDERERRGEKRLTFNYARVFIDKVTSYLMSGTDLRCRPAAATDRRKGCQAAETALNRVYDENNLEQLDLETEIDCAILGDACYKVIWDAETKQVRVTAPDVQGIYAWWLRRRHLPPVARRLPIPLLAEEEASAALPCQRRQENGQHRRSLDGQSNSSFTWITPSWSASPTPTASSPSSFIPTCASRSSSGASPTCPRSWSRSAS